MDFESANPSVVKSTEQRDLLNNWLRLFARERRLPRVAEYVPARIDEELPDLVCYAVHTAEIPPRPIARQLPDYTVSHIDDRYGRIVAYERLLLPFSDADDVHVIHRVPGHIPAGDVIEFS